MRTIWIKAACAAGVMAAALAACGDDESTTPVTSTATTASSSSGSGGTTTTTSSTGGGTTSSSSSGGGGGSAPAGASYTATISTDGEYPYFCKIHTGPMTGVVYVGAQTGAGGAGGAGGSGSGTVHGCDFVSAEDMTSMTAVTLEWTNPHDRCIKVDNGTAITWQGTFAGSFTTHPISGGVSPTADTGSPIDCDASSAPTCIN